MMICRDLLEAELATYGDFKNQLSIRIKPGGEDRINDLAQAWIDGDRERVIAHARAHDQQVRNRMTKSEKPTYGLRERARDLRKQGWSTVEIVKCLRVSAAFIVKACRDLPKPTRRRRKVNLQSVVALRNRGLTYKQIGEELGLSLWTVFRALKKTPS